MALAQVRNRAHKSTSKKDNKLRQLWKLLITVIVLTIILIGIGVLLLWFLEPNNVDRTIELAAPSQKPEFTKPRKSGPNIPIGSAVQSVSSPISPGDNASLSIRTTEGAACSVKVVLLDPHGKEISRVDDSGLMDKKVDDFGLVTWTWTMPDGASLGEWKGDVVCVRDEMSTRSAATIVVE